MTLEFSEQKITNPEDVYNLCRSALSFENEVDQDKEHFWVIGLNTAGAVQYFELVSLGILNAAVVHPREVFRFAIMKGVASLILAHNHPSGATVPSSEDLQITRQLVDSGKILDIKVQDHIIVTKNSYLSFQAEGLI